MDFLCFLVLLLSWFFFSSFLLPVHGEAEVLSIYTPSTGGKVAWAECKFLNSAIHYVPPPVYC